MSEDPQGLDHALEALLQRRPDATLDARARSRLAEVLADPEGETWMESAGLLDGDSCGYPVEGGYWDVKGDLDAAPDLDEATRARVLSALVQEWADDYVAGGRANLDRKWRSYLDGEG